MPCEKSAMTGKLKFSPIEWIKLSAIVLPVLVTLAWSIVGLFMKVEYIQGRLYEQKGELMSLESNDKERAISQSVITQQLVDISQRLIRIENKMDGVK